MQYIIINGENMNSMKIVPILLLAVGTAYASEAPKSAFKSSINTKTINDVDENGQTHAIRCAIKNNSITLKALIQAGADLTIRDTTKQTALTHALNANNPITVDMILANCKSEPIEHYYLAYLRNGAAPEAQKRFDAIGAVFMKHYAQALAKHSISMKIETLKKIADLLVMRKCPQGLDRVKFDAQIKQLVTATVQRIKASTTSNKSPQQPITKAEQTSEEYNQQKALVDSKFKDANVDSLAEFYAICQANNAQGGTTNKPLYYYTMVAMMKRCMQMLADDTCIDSGSLKKIADLTSKIECPENANRSEFNALKQHVVTSTLQLIKKASNNNQPPLRQDPVKSEEKRSADANTSSDSDTESEGPEDCFEYEESLPFLEQMKEEERKEYLQGKSATKSLEFGATPLMHAANDGDLRLLKTILSKNKKMLYKKDSVGRNALFYATSGNHADAARLLIENGITVEDKDEDNETCLMLAAKYGYAKIVQMLLENKAKINAQDKDGDTPLMHAITWNYAEIVKILLQYNPDLTIQNKRKMDALGLAVYASDDGILMRHTKNQPLKEILNLNNKIIWMLEKRSDGFTEEINAQKIKKTNKRDRIKRTEEKRKMLAEDKAAQQIRANEKEAKERIEKEERAKKEALLFKERKLARERQEKDKEKHAHAVLAPMAKQFRNNKLTSAKKELLFAWKQVALKKREQEQIKQKNEIRTMLIEDQAAQILRAQEKKQKGERGKMQIEDQAAQALRTQEKEAALVAQFRNISFAVPSLAARENRKQKDTIATQGKNIEQTESLLFEPLNAQNYYSSNQLSQGVSGQNSLFQTEFAAPEKQNKNAIDKP